MVKHLPPDRVVQAARALAGGNNALFAEFLILKHLGISATNPVTLTNTSTTPGIELLMAVRQGNGEPVVSGNPYFNPFARSDGWRIDGYARSGPQTNIDGPNMSRVFDKIAGPPASASLKADYLSLMAPGLLSRMRKAPRIPLGEAAIWAARATPFADGDDGAAVERWFEAQFKITTAERAAFFIGGIAPEDPLAAGSPDLDALSSAIIAAFPPRQTTGMVVTPLNPDEQIAQAEVELPSDLLERIRGELVIPDVTVRQLITLVRMGKNVILTGSPGTGKSTLAERLARVAAADAAKPQDDREFDLPLCAGYLPTTATADWSTFDTIGGYVPAATNGTLEFREGLFLQAIRENRWLIIDELNRADADKAFGQLFSVLSGQAVDLPFRSHASGSTNLSIRRDATSNSNRFEAADGQYVIAANWRIIATMNTFDRNHLFQLSAAFVRRFAVVNVPVPTVAELEGWLHARNIEAWVLVRIKRLLSLLDRERPLGPAIIKDVIDYVNLRLAALPGAAEIYSVEGVTQAGAGAIAEAPMDDQYAAQDEQSGAPGSVMPSEDPFLEAVIAFILPQMDGLDASALTRVRSGLRDVVAASSVAELDRQFRDLFRV